MIKAKPVPSELNFFGEQLGKDSKLLQELEVEKFSSFDRC